jgi:large subunit ribosomal protein L13
VQWHVIDAEGMVLGRLCTEVARVLRGKHKPTFAPHIDTGDHVVIVNADKVVMTKNKAANKGVYRHSGYPGGLKSETYQTCSSAQARRGRSPQRPRHAAEGPARPSADQEAEGVRGPEHPHAAQNPVPSNSAAAKAR